MGCTGGLDMIDQPGSHGTRGVTKKARLNGQAGRGYFGIMVKRPAGLGEGIAVGESIPIPQIGEGHEANVPDNGRPSSAAAGLRSLHQSG